MQLDDDIADRVFQPIINSTSQSLIAFKHYGVGSH
jgi:hypothetical protein